jgi:hypothetical protein
MPYYPRPLKSSPEERARNWELVQKYRAKTPDWKEKHNRARREYNKRNPEMKLYRSAKWRAKTDGLEFNIDVSDIAIPATCPILGTPLFFTDGLKTNNTPSLDRVDNTKGYVKGNVRVISVKANTMKGDLALDIMDKFIRYMKWEI